MGCCMTRCHFGSRVAWTRSTAGTLSRATEMVLARAILSCTIRANNDLEAATEHDAAMTALEGAGVAAWAVEYFRQDATRTKAARK